MIGSEEPVRRPDAAGGRSAPGSVSAPAPACGSVWVSPGPAPAPPGQARAGDREPPRGSVPASTGSGQEPDRDPVIWELDRVLFEGMARPQDSGRSRGPGPRLFTWITRHPDLLLVPGLLLVTAVLRLVAYAGAYDIYVDEYFYQRMGASVAAGHVPPGDGREMFVLHPPGFFILEALWQALTSPPVVQFDQVMAMRRLQIVLAVATALGIYLLLRPIVGRWTTVLAVLVFAVDPFVLRQNGRVLLETATVAFVVLGWVPILRVVRGGVRRPVVALVGGGLLLGCATATKDLGLFLTTIPLLAVLAFRWGLTRRQAVVAIVASLVPYAAFVAGVVWQGGTAQLWQAKTGALSRLFGFTVITGYNAPGAPSLIDVALGQLAGFGSSYLIMGLGTLAAVWLVLRGPRPEHRTVGTVQVSAAVLVGYGAVFATSEEHLFYLMIVPAMLSLAAAVRLLLDAALRRAAGAGRRSSRWATAAIAILLAITVVVDVSAWVHTRTTPDDGQRRVVAWIRQNVPPGTAVAYVAGQTELQLAGTAWPAVPLDTPATMAAARVRYLVVLQKEVQQRYSSASPQEVAWYAARGREVFAFVGPSYGRVSIYRTVDPRLW
jgi:4-amino-4-deoxy-L-arabinose transferase-like glycosyltransferase